MLSQPFKGLNNYIYECIAVEYFGARITFCRLYPNQYKVTYNVTLDNNYHKAYKFGNNKFGSQ